MNKYLNLMLNPRAFINSGLKHCSFLFSDKAYLSLRFYLSSGKRINWRNPQTFNEKQAWLKLYDRKPEYTIMVDKYLVKQYVADIIGDEYIIPTIGVYNRVSEIDFDELPQQFVVKCNHNSGTGMIICKDKSKLDIKRAKKVINKGLRENYFLKNREWPYKDVQRKIIVEKFMVDSKHGELRDYKFFCFDGVVKALFIASDRSKGDEAVRFDFFDADFNHLPLVNGHPNSVVMPEKPSQFEKMKEIAAILSKGIPSVRIDLYEINGKIYFGEMTFTHWGGYMAFEPFEWDLKFGSWITLPER